MTPQHSSLEPALPTLLSAKNMSSISTTSSNSPEQVKVELLKVLGSRGIECKCKGFSIRGKVQAANTNVCKLTFELEVCLIPTTASSYGFVVGIKRKRLRGDAWVYKCICEEILNMANLS